MYVYWSLQLKARKSEPNFVPKSAKEHFTKMTLLKRRLYPKWWHKNIRNRSPEEENQMPASKRPRHTGLIGEIDAFTLKDLRGSSGDDSSRCSLQESSACTPQRPLEKTASSLLMDSASSNAPVLSLSLSHNSPMECKYVSPFAKSGEGSPPIRQELLTPPNSSWSRDVLFKNTLINHW